MNGEFYECKFDDACNVSISIINIGTIPVIKANGQLLLDKWTKDKLNSKYPNLHIISTDEWNTYVQSVVKQANDLTEWEGVYPWTYWTFDTKIADDGINYEWGDYKNHWFYIEQFGLLAQGYELNYFGQGALYARMKLDESKCYQFPYAWKIFSWAFNRGNGYTLPTKNELIFTYYGYYYYGGPKLTLPPVIIIR